MASKFALLLQALMRTCAGEAGGAAALYGPDSPFPEGLLLHRLFEEMVAGQSSEAGEKVWRDIRMTTRRILSGLLKEYTG